MADQEQPFQRGMVIMAHPDDAEWTCSATVAKWCAEGWEVVYVLCTDGSKGSDDPEMTSEQLVKIREDEQREAHDIHLRAIYGRCFRIGKPLFTELKPPELSTDSNTT